jgi:hypothetical protein
MNDLETIKQRGKMVKLNPKSAVKMQHLADERGTNVNALTNRIIRRYLRWQKEQLENAAELTSSNTMPTQAQ